MIDERIWTRRVNAAETTVPKIRGAFDQPVVTVRHDNREVKKKKKEKSRLFRREVTLIKMRVNVRPLARILFQKFKRSFIGNVCHNNNAATRRQRVVSAGEILLILRIF